MIIEYLPSKDVSADEPGGRRFNSRLISPRGTRLLVNAEKLESSIPQAQECLWS